MRYAFFIFTLLLGFLAHAAEFDLGRYWMQDRILRSVMVSIGKSPEQQLSILDRSLSALQKMKSQEPTVVQVDSLGHLEKIREKYFRSAGSLDLDVEEFAQGKNRGRWVISTSSPEVEQTLQKMAEAYRKNLDKEMTFPPRKWWVSFLAMTGATKYRDTSLFEILTESSKDSDLLMNYLKRLSSEEKLDQIKQLTEKLEPQIKAMDHVALNALEASKLSFPDPLLAKAVKIILATYFADLELSERLEFISAILERPEEMSAMEIFKRVGRKADPQFQKIFQMVGRDPGFSQELRKVFESFEESLPPASADYVLEKRKRFERIDDLNLIEMEMEPKAVGSAAQIHRARFERNGDVIEAGIRILKPGIQKKFEKGNQRLELVGIALSQDPDLRAKLPSLKQIIEDLKQMGLNEANLYKTVPAQKKAKLYETDLTHQIDGKIYHVRLRVPEVLSHVDEQVYIMRWVQGGNLDQILHTNPLLARIATEDWAKTWLKEAFFQTGFTHADPHPGNLRYLKVDDQTVEAGIIDYGMVGEISEQLQLKFALLSVASVAGADELIARVLWEIGGSPTHLSPEELTKSVHSVRAELLAKGHSPTVKTWTDLGLQKGLVFPTDFTILGRGLIATLRALKLAGSTMTLDGLVRQVIMENPQILWKMRSLPSLIKPMELVDLGSKLLGKADSFIAETLQKKQTELMDLGAKAFNQIESNETLKRAKDGLLGWFNSGNKKAEEAKSGINACLRILNGK